MVPKTERFEMRLDEDIITQVDEWRSSQGDLPSRAEAMRRLVERGLATGSRGGDVVLTDGEKLLAMMLRDVYKKVGVKDGDIDPDFVQDAICGGHYNWAFKWEMSGLFHTHMDEPKQLDFVAAVLDMWSLIEAALERLSKTDKASAAELTDRGRFLGFDGNYESAYLGIALFLVGKMGRFSRFEKRDLNAHMPMVRKYQTMLRIFEPMRSAGKGLNVKELTDLLA